MPFHEFFQKKGIFSIIFHPTVHNCTNVNVLIYILTYLLKKIVDIYDSSRITQIVPHNIHIYTQEKIVGENSSDGLEKS